MKTGKIVVDNTTGKLSLARTAQRCPQCHPLQLKLHILNKQLVQLKEENHKYQQQEHQMTLLCEEIAKIKSRLKEKMESRR